MKRIIESAKTAAAVASYGARLGFAYFVMRSLEAELHQKHECRGLVSDPLQIAHMQTSIAMVERELKQATINYNVLAPSNMRRTLHFA